MCVYLSVKCQVPIPDPQILIAFGLHTKFANFLVEKNLHPFMSDRGEPMT